MSDSTENISFGLRKNEKLKSTKAIDGLFSDGRLISYGHIILKYKVRPAIDAVPFKMGVTVSRKKFKHSVDRNFVKRILREAYRMQKPSFHQLLWEQFPGADFMFIYNSNTKPEFSKTMEEMKGVLRKLSSKVRKNDMEPMAQPILNTPHNNETV
jgi:ribonuclease P protein component